MIQLNVTALVHPTGLVLPGMLTRRRGGILNVASIAGYIPGPGQAVYNGSMWDASWRTVANTSSCEQLGCVGLLLVSLSR
jgi:NADP-dependent 3-hydroxy acid dehydrogenase YdfG